MGWGTHIPPQQDLTDLFRKFITYKAAIGNISLSVNPLKTPFQRYLTEENKMELMRTQWRRQWEHKGKVPGPAVGTSQMKGGHCCHLSLCGILTLSQHTINFNLMNSSLSFMTLTSQENCFMINQGLKQKVLMIEPKEQIVSEGHSQPLAD